MRRLRSVTWWWWLLTSLALAARIGGWWRQGLAAAAILTALYGIHVALRAASPIAFPVQIRATYLVLLALGSWRPFAWVHVAQLAGTMVLLAFDYCPLARMVSLLPWNRRGPITLARVRATFLTPPVPGSILKIIDAGPLSVRGDATKP